jgi:hypothetical protein
VPHDLSPDLARRAAAKAWESYAARYAAYEPRLTWTTPDRGAFAFVAMGVRIDGTIEIEPDAIAFDLRVPLLLRVFRKRALEVVEREAERWIRAARAGELDG